MTQCWWQLATTVDQTSTCWLRTFGECHICCGAQIMFKIINFKCTFRFQEVSVRPYSLLKTYIQWTHILKISLKKTAGLACHITWNADVLCGTSLMLYHVKWTFLTHFSINCCWHKFHVIKPTAKLNDGIQLNPNGTLQTCLTKLKSGGCFIQGMRICTEIYYFFERTYPNSCKLTIFPSFFPQGWLHWYKS